MIAQRPLLSAEAQHLTGELVGRYREDRRPPPSALALHAESSSYTAIWNDFGAEEVVARQVRAHGRPGDVLVALTTSGSSPNVVAAVEAAAGYPPTVQELHQVVVHLLCAAVDEELSRC